MALFQLACVMGDWTRAGAQLDMMAKLDAEATVLARVYGRLLDAEAVRRRVFAGIERPVALGRPPAWLAMLVQALEADAAGDRAAAADLRGRALDEAPPTPGDLDGQPVAWLMDADPRLGPALEVVADGHYRWLPFSHLLALRAEPPQAMRDLVWQPATATLATGSELHVFLPARYPGTELAEADALRLARATAWVERDAGQPFGLGQRLLASDQGDHALLDLRRLRFEAAVMPATDAA